MRELADKGQAAEARSGKRVSLVPHPELAEDQVVDLEVVVTVHKAALARAERIASLDETVHERRFRNSVARRFGRFAFPDEVNLALGPMKSLLRSKARKVQSPLGKVLAGVRTVRVEATMPAGWEGPTFDLTLHLVFEVGVLPDITGLVEPIAEPSGLREKVSGPNGSLQGCSAAVAGLLEDASDASIRYWLWNYLGESLAADCAEAAQANGVDGVVTSIGFELSTVDEFTFARYENSEDLDLDDLSDPKR